MREGAAELAITLPASTDVLPAGPARLVFRRAIRTSFFILEYPDNPRFLHIILRDGTVIFARSTPLAGADMLKERNGLRTLGRNFVGDGGMLAGTVEARTPRRGTLLRT